MDKEYTSTQSRRARDAYEDERRSSPRLAAASDAELRALELATYAAEGVRAAREDLAEIKAALGRAPSPGHDGAGLIGAVSEMQAAQRALLAREARLEPSAERRAPSRARQLARAPLVVALVAALGGGAGIAGIVEAARGRHAAPQVQTTER
ncbi:hypothetical protein [Sorangium sp. So ce1151]|uniref:hypothetical protein n=1 Tax=Sorangium sp. So ce1151 TaxID=3133332 RepID=UPI003F5EF5D1